MSVEKVLDFQGFQQFEQGFLQVGGRTVLISDDIFRRVAHRCFFVHIPHLGFQICIFCYIQVSNRWKSVFQIPKYFLSSDLSCIASATC